MACCGGGGLACLWDPAVRWPVACLYCVGLVAVGLYLDGLDLRAPLFQWALANALAAYSLATSALWSVRERLRAMQPVGSTGQHAKPQASDGAVWHEGSGHGWLVPANFVIGVCVLLLVSWIEVSIGDLRSEWLRRMPSVRRLSRLVCSPRGACERRCNTWRWCGACCLPSRLAGRGCRPISRRPGCTGWS